MVTALRYRGRLVAGASEPRASELACVNAGATQQLEQVNSDFMQYQIRESDWKRWRILSNVALDRFCERVLQRAAELSSGEDSAHARYLALYRFVRESDKELGRLFDGQSRSNAYFQIAGAVQSKLISREELSTFSEETNQMITLLLESASTRTTRRRKPKA